MTVHEWVTSVLECGRHYMGVNLEYVICQVEVSRARGISKGDLYGKPPSIERFHMKSRLPCWCCKIKKGGGGGA